MPSATAPQRPPVWGLWIAFTAAAMGFAVFLAGLLGGDAVPLMAGAGLMTFATLAYLLLHFSTTAHAAFAGEPEAPRKGPVKARLVRRTAPAPAMAPLVDRAARHPPEATNRTASGWDYTDHAPATPRAVEHQLVAHAPRGGEPGAFGALLTEPAPPAEFQHARARRGDIVRSLPLIRGVFEPEAATRTTDHPARPGKTRGRCSGCNTVLWAPATRPVRLRCPSCGRTKWLEK